MNPKQTFFTTILFIVFTGNIFAQSNKSLFIGIQPSITVEPFYEKGELDVNVFPLIIETPIGLRTNFRLAPIANYHFGGSTKGFSDIGLYTFLAIYFRKREIAASRPCGFYIGPVLGFGRNLINKHYTTTLAVEPGYMFEAKKSFTITLGIQFGSSYFSYDSKPNNWAFHWGPKVTFGFWFDSTK